MSWFNNFMDSWVYAIMVIDMVLFWGLIVPRADRVVLLSGQR
jgi:hypothetical protein